MKNENISQNVIRRMPRYLRKLEDLLADGVERISSAELGRQLGLTPSQIRQDFSRFGEFGQQGYGYNVSALRDEVASILGVGRGFSIVLIGAGNLGHALIRNFGFGRYGFKLLAAFDVDPGMIGTSIAGVPVLSADRFTEYAEANSIDIAVLAVPGHSAGNIAHMVAKSGIKAIWNFTNMEIAGLAEDVIVENIHFSDSLLALSYYLSESRKGD